MHCNQSGKSSKLYAGMMRDTFMSSILSIKEERGGAKTWGMKIHWEKDRI